MRKILVIVLLVLGSMDLFAAGTVKTYTFATRDSCVLRMDVYSPAQAKKKNTCLVFVFGGGFKMGNRTHNLSFLTSMTDSGYVVAAIDYRLGMKGVKAKGFGQIKAIKHAIDLAVEDLYSATNYLLEHAEELNIDSSKIVISGSSAGAITVLQADYERCNHSQAASVLPSGFRYAGVVACAGAVFSTRGTPEYAEAPAPTLMFHGTEDKLVLYNKKRIFNYVFAGTNELTRIFEKNNYPYFTYRYKGLGHEVAGIPMRINQGEICGFINDYVLKSKKLKKDFCVEDPDIRPSKTGAMRPNDLYK